MLSNYELPGYKKAGTSLIEYLFSPPTRDRPPQDCKTLQTPATTDQSLITALRAVPTTNEAGAARFAVEAEGWTVLFV